MKRKGKENKFLLKNKLIIKKIRIKDVENFEKEKS